MCMCVCVCGFGLPPFSINIKDGFTPFLVPTAPNKTAAFEVKKIQVNSLAVVVSFQGLAMKLSNGTNLTGISFLC